MNHPFNDDRCKRRLLWEYQHYDKLIVGIDFDNTIKPVKGSASCSEVIELLKRCSEDPKITLCLWSMCSNEEEVNKKLQYCAEQGITVDYVNTSPFNPTEDKTQKKQFFNVLLDDRAGLESAYNNLKYVLDNVGN